jgi:hypothetical protein
VDGARFDAITRSLSEPVRRRRLVVGFVAGALGLVGVRPTDAAACRAPSLVCREHANCCSGRCGPKDRTGRRRCRCQSPHNCPVPDACHEATCAAGVCGTVPVTPVATLADCGGRCDDLSSAAAVTLCSQTVPCPRCADCAALGCAPGGVAGIGPAGIGLYCTVATFDGFCSTFTDCPVGHGCFGVNCLPICTG